MPREETGTRRPSGEVKPRGSVVIPLVDAAPGMMLSEPVITRDGKILMDAGIEISNHLIDLFDLWGIGTVSVITERKGAPKHPRDEVPAARAFKYEKKRIEEAKAGAKNLERTVRNLARNILSRVEARRNLVDRERIQRLALKLVDEAVSNKEVMTSLTTIRSYDNYLFAHSLHVSILSIVTGISMGLTKGELYVLSEGGLLHDVGMPVIPQEIWNKDGKLTDDEYYEIKKHPIFGLDVVEKILNGEPEMEKVIYQHHERLDGSGYPKGITGKRIHLLARITAVADVYDAMQSDRKYRSKMLAYDVMSHLMRSTTSTLDPDVVRAFLRCMSVYPIGSFVVLDSREIGIVLSANASSPIRPVVKIVVGRDGNEIEQPEIVDLFRDARYILGPIHSDAVGMEPWEAI